MFTRHTQVTRGGPEEVRILLLESVCVSGVLLVQLGPPALRAATMVLLILWAVRSPRAAIQALSVGTLVVLANPGLATQHQYVTILKWVLLLVSLIRVAMPLPLGAKQRVDWMGSFAIYIAATALLAVAVSYDLTLSILKLTTFGAGVVVALLAFSYVRLDRGYWLSWFLTLHSVVLFMSIPLLGLPVGYYKDGLNFQGITAHAQTYGVYIAPMTCYLLLCALTSRHPLRPLTIAALSIATIWASGCRTAMLALIVACASSFLVTILTRSRSYTLLTTRTAVRNAAIACLCLSLLLLYRGANAVDWLLAFGAKHYSGPETTALARLVGASAGTRGKQIRQSWATIVKYPFAGVGFGLAPPEVGQIVIRDPIFHLPISAPTEQGFLPLGVLAQVGLLGAGALGIFLCHLFRPVLYYSTFPVIGLCMTAFFVNFGELVFFAAGDLGLQIWLTFGLCYHSAKQEESFRSLRAKP